VQAVLPLHLILSLPNQLLAHVPITEISSILTDRLTKGEKDDEDMEIDANAEEEEEDDSETPELSQLYRPGQYVAGIVTQNFPSESSNKAFLGMYTPTEQTRLASRIEMSLRPDKVNEGVMKADVATGYRMTGALKSEEDHGWSVDLGLKDIEGFLKKDEVKGKELHVGQILDFVVTSASGRLAQLTMDETQCKRALAPEVYTNVSSILPGHLISCLITAIIPAGLNVKISGFFDGTIDLTHLGIGDKDIDKEFKAGKKVGSPAHEMGTALIFGSP
jgi:rRNA biogenesis protein RRP5